MVDSAEKTNNVLGMSDEDIANIDPATLEDDTSTDNTDDTGDEDEVAATNEGDGEETQETTDDSGETDSDHESDDEDGESDDDTSSTDDDAKSEAASDGESGTDSDTSEKVETDDTDQSTAESEIDYKAEYEKVMAPFKANGKEMRVKTPEEVRQLMQMGANYNKKMASLKPNLKLMKTLENNNLLNEEQINYLVDLTKGNTEAIQKLMKDSGVDPLEFDQQSEKEYRPKSYTADDREVELDSVLDEIKETPKYSETINVVSNKWDDASKQLIAENPQVLKIINEHMHNGVFEQVTAEVERERAFGRLTGISDIEAYKQVGDALEERNGLSTQKSSDTETKRSEKQTVAKKTLSSEKSKEDPKLKEKKRAASSTKSSGSNGKKQADYNPLAMSDDEFEKMVNENLM